MSFYYSTEDFFGYPVPTDGVSFGNISANGITALISAGNIVFSGSYSFDTVTITLKGIPSPAPLTKPSASNIGSTVFSFRDRTWTLLDITEGYKFKIATQSKYESWSCTGVDLSRPTVKV